ncbi:MAG TPA: porin family protein [Chitinophagales bacterium]|nr:porin family protein [Chitinophagales bacterium]
MRIIIAITLILGVSCLQAQINAGDPKNKEFKLFEGGVYAGANFSQVHGDFYAGFDKIGLNAGPVVHVNLNQTWSISLELLYSQKGARSKPDPNNLNTYLLVLDYAEAPILINYNDKNRLIFQAGLAYGRMINTREEINGIDNDNSEAIYSDELSYLIGGTLLIGEMKHFGVNFRYQGSITTVGESADPKVVGLVNSLVTLRGVYYF